MRARLTVAAVFAGLIAATTVASAQDQDQDHQSAIAACLKAWGDQPFGTNPKYRTLQTSVRVFGIGGKAGDSAKTAAPELVLVNPGVNVMGGTTIDLLNPNGWYCFRSTVNVMGGLTIRAHCETHLASSIDGATVMGNSADSKSVTVMGSTTVERVGCK